MTGVCMFETRVRIWRVYVGHVSPYSARGIRTGFIRGEGVGEHIHHMHNIHTRGGEP